MPELLRAGHIGATCDIQQVSVPIDCVDGFTEAFYARPERFLDPAVRRSQSAWTFVEDADETRTVEHLRRDLDGGAWDERHGHLRTQPEFVGSLRLLIGHP